MSIEPLTEGDIELITKLMGTKTMDRRNFLQIGATAVSPMFVPAVGAQAAAGATQLSDASLMALVGHYQEIHPSHINLDPYFYLLPNKAHENAERKKPHFARNGPNLSALSSVKQEETRRWADEVARLERLLHPNIERALALVKKSAPKEDNGDHENDLTFSATPSGKEILTILKEIGPRTAENLFAEHWPHISREIDFIYKRLRGIWEGLKQADSPGTGKNAPDLPSGKQENFTVPRPENSDAPSIPRLDEPVSEDLQKVVDAVKTSPEDWLTRATRSISKPKTK